MDLKELFADIKPSSELKFRVKNKIFEKKEKYSFFKKHLALKTVSIFMAIVFGFIVFETLPKNYYYAGGGTFKSYAEVESYIKKNTSSKKPNTINFFDNYILKATMDDNLDASQDSILAPDPTSPGTNDSSNDVKESTNHSTTNNQVAGVDESDIIKNMGDFQYIISYNTETSGWQSQISIINSDTLAIVCVLQFDSYFAQELFVSDNYLVVLGSLNEDGNYNYNKYYENSLFLAKILNIEMLKLAYLAGKTSDEIEELALVREIELPHAYLNVSRMIDNRVYLVLSSYQFYYDNELYIPEYRDSNLDNEYHKLKPLQIYKTPTNREQLNFNIVVSFNLDDNSKAVVQSYLGTVGTIYSSLTSLYISFTSYTYQSYIFDYSIVEAYTIIMRFDYTVDGVDYLGAAKVKGTVLNQFSLDEYDGTIRVVTTNSGIQGANQSESCLYVIDNSTFQVLSTVGNLGLGERVYSVRFNNTQAAVVTYRETDPLYIINIQDKNNAFLEGELKIPNLSDYMHYYNDDIIFAIGRMDSSMSVKVSLFDVSNPNEPIEIALYDDFGDYAFSESNFNHKATMAYKNIYAFTTTSYDFLLNTATSFANIFEIDLDSSDYFNVSKLYLTADNETIRRTTIVEFGEQSFIYLIGNKTLDKYDLNSLQLVSSVELFN